MSTAIRNSIFNLREGIGIAGGQGWNVGSPSGMTAITYSDTRIDLYCDTYTKTIDGYCWERSTNGVDFTEVAVTEIPICADIIPALGIYQYRVRAYKGAKYTDYSSIVAVTPEMVVISSVNSSITLADASNDYYFNDGSGNDLPFTILATAKVNLKDAAGMLICRGNSSGMSYYIQLNTSANTADFSIYGNDARSIQLYKSANPGVVVPGNLYKFAFTYSGNKSATGMKIYLDGNELSYNMSQNSGTYVNMNNRDHFVIGHSEVYTANYAHSDINLLLVADKALSAAEVTEYQNMTEENDLTELSFYSNLISANKFKNNLNDEIGSHNGTSVSPVYKNLPKYKYLPSVTESTFQSTFKNFKLGWFMHFNMETFTGNEFTWKSPVEVGNPALFNVANIDVAAWAALAASYGKIDYAILSVVHIQGFSLYDHKTAIWKGTQVDMGGGYLCPAYTKYDVGITTGYKNIVPDFIEEFNAVGIKPILYFHVAGNRNYYFDKDPIDCYTDSDYQWAANHQFRIDRLKELAALNPFAIWLDGTDGFYPTDYVRDLYYAIKSVNPSVGVILNIWYDTDRNDPKFGAADATASEEVCMSSIGVGSANDWWTKKQRINNIEYPCIKEYVLTSRSNNEWFCNATPAALRTISAVQTVYDYAKGINIPCSISVCPKPDGTIDVDQADLVGDIVL
jgi:hypothetical protein